MSRRSRLYTRRMSTHALETQRDAPEPRKAAPWLGVAADVLLTLVLLVLGIDPVFDLVTGYRKESAFALGLLHMVMVPAAMLTGLIRSDKLGFFTERPGFVQKAADTIFVLFYLLGWLVPTLVFAQRARVPGWLIGGCIVVHVVPVVATVVLGLFKRAFWMDRAAEWIARQTSVMAVVYAAYLAGVEVFLMLGRLEGRGFAGMALFVWALAYLPTRLLLARITGLRGPERFTFVASNVHLLLRLLLASPE